MKSVSAAALEILLAGLVIPSGFLLAKEIEAKMDNAAAHTENISEHERQKVVTHADGSKELLVKWPVGSTDNIKILRIPFGYVEPMTLADCWSFGKEPPEECRFGYETEVLLRAVLPNFQPQERDAKNEVEDRPNVSIKIDSSFTDTNDPGNAKGLRKEAYVAKFMLPIRAGNLKIGPKGSLYGLRRIGPIHDSTIGDAAYHIDDLYFDGDSPESSDNFLVCTDLSASTPLERPDAPGVPHCTQYFAVPELSAVAELRYERQHSPEWKDIKERALIVLRSFNPK